MGEIRKRGKSYQIRYSRNGRRFEEAAGKTRAAAVELLKKREGDGAYGLPVNPKTGKIWFEEAVEDLLNGLPYQSTTIPR